MMELEFRYFFRFLMAWSRMPIEIAQDMQVGIRQFLRVGDPYSKFVCVLKMPWFTFWQVDYQFKT